LTMLLIRRILLWPGWSW